MGELFGLHSWCAHGVGGNEGMVDLDWLMGKRYDGSPS